MNDATIYDDLCLGCAAVKKKGFIAMIMHDNCPLHVANYYAGSFSLRKMHNLFSGINPLQSFFDLVSAKELPHFKPIKKIKHPLDEMLYKHARNFEISTMKRIRKQIIIEERFDAKY